MIDVYRGKLPPERSLMRYALFVSFFPQLVAGPIERSENLLRQVNEDHPLDEKAVRDGLLVMLLGFFEKLVIADRASLYVDAVYGNWQQASGLQILLATAAFAFQIYCDFSAYSDIARGSAKMLGFDLMQNFNCPYFAVSIKDFWRRWHISLSSWFKDYLYFPLGGSRCSKWRHRLNIMIVFAVSGLWHGAALTFVAWGLLNGLYQVLSDLLQPARNTKCSGSLSPSVSPALPGYCSGPIPCLTPCRSTAPSSVFLCPAFTAAWPLSAFPSPPWSSCSYAFSPCLPPTGLSTTGNSLRN